MRTHLSSFHQDRPEAPLEILCATQRNQTLVLRRARRNQRAKSLDAILRPGAVKSVKLNRIANHTIEKVVEFQIRALRVLRGKFLPISAVER